MKIGCFYQSLTQVSSIYRIIYNILMIRFSNCQSKLLIIATVLFLSLLNAGNARNVAFCVDLDDPIQVLAQPGSRRNLQSIANPHGLRITFVQPPADPLVNSTQINNMFSIVSLFFKQLLKVTDVTDNTRYTSSYDCGLIKNTSTYGTVGFSFQNSDMIVSTFVENKASQSYAAFASPCLIRSWVQYGYIGVNTYYFSSDPAVTANSQENLLTLLHQMSHILGMTPSLFNGNFRKAYLDPINIPSCQSVTTYGSRSFITTPNVQAWVQSHYGCDQSSIGALLEEQGSVGSVGSHWERATTLDDYMTASIYAGYKITPITLHLFKDSGYYYDVDFSLAQNIEFGKNKGCSFARGLLNSSQASPQYCTSNTTSNGFTRLIDFYSFFGGACATEDFSSGLQLVRSYINYKCYDSANTQYSFSSLNTFGALSRSFYANQSQWNGVHCFEATCDANKNNIQIKIKGFTGTCVRGGSSTIVINGTTVYCPTNFNIFCSRENCPDHCGSKGYCSQGSCLSTTLCSSIGSNCVRCKGNTCTGCASGLFPTGKTNPVCNTCLNILPTCSNGCEVTQKGLTVCKKINTLSPIIGTCSTCIAVLYCSSCTLDNNGTNCLTCSNDSNGNPRYPTADKQSCKTCREFITNCITCTVTSGKAVCSKCTTGLYPTANGSACQSCKLFIANCATCTVTSGKATCLTCSSRYFLNVSLNKCQACQTGCTVCTSTTSCTTCAAKYYKLQNICYACPSTCTGNCQGTKLTDGTLQITCL